VLLVALTYRLLHTIYVFLEIGVDSLDLLSMVSIYIRKVIVLGIGAVSFGLPLLRLYYI